MITDNTNVWNSPVRNIKGQVELFDSSTVSTSGKGIINLRNVYPKAHNITCKIRNTNLIPFPYVNTTVTINGVTYTVNEDRSVTANGTATADAFFYLSNDILLPPGTYIFNSPNTTTDNRELRAALNNLDGTLDEYPQAGTAFTTTENKKLRIYLVILSGNTIENVTFYPQLELGTVATDYSQYVADLSAVSVKRVGKNLFNINDAILESKYNARIENNKILYDYTDTMTDDFVFSYWLDVKKNTTYKISLNGSTIKNYYLYTDKLLGTSLGSKTLTSYFNSGNNTKILVGFYSEKANRPEGSGTATISDVQIELGTAASEYEKYKGQTANSNAAGIVNGLTSATPNMTITATVPDVIIDIEYKKRSAPVSITSGGKLKSFTIERVGEEGKFFGFGICQKANLHLVDKNRETTITTANFMKYKLSASNTYISPFPYFYVSEVHRDENTNELSITAYDTLYTMAEHTVSELNLVAPYTIETVAKACASLLSVNLLIAVPVGDTSFSLNFPTGANFEGTETIREVLNAIAEATQTIYYLDSNEKLVFKRLDKSGNAVLTIGKSDYIELSSKTNRKLGTLVSATELGDNVSASLEQSGSTQYVRDNPFWDIQEEVATLVENALAAIGGLTINQFDCSWRGNAALEVGDKIDLVTKDNNTVTSFVLNDTITYDGSLSEKTAWHYEDTAETAENPSTLGGILKQTYARVDKANAEIEIVAGETTSLKMTTESITSSVKKLGDDMTSVVQAVNTKTTPEDVSLSISTALADGIDRVTTTTGFTFNEEGLHISKTDSEITTSITEDGMTVYKNNEAVLVADNQGVEAEDLHATTYLIVGNNSRFEDFIGTRTGCFWIGN